jgi:hypothetical protein
MHLETTTFERAIHLALFVVGGVAFAIGALAALERILGGEERTIRLRYVAIAAVAFAALAAIEAMFHVLS